MSDPLMLGEFLDALPPRGTYQCATCHSATVELPGDCDGCTIRVAQRAHAKLMRPAIESVPERFQWARPSHPEWAARVSAPARDGLARVVGRSIPKLGFTIVGGAGSGKTSAACSILHALHDRASYDSEAWRVERARRAYFVSALQLETDAREYKFGEAPMTMRQARSASVLVLDDVGQGGRKSDEIANIIQERHNREACTIVTTPMDRAEASKLYGDGFARRLFEAVEVIRCKHGTVRAISEAG